MKNPAIQNDRILDFLIGDVKTATTWSYHVKNNVKTFKEHRKRYYDRNGSRTKTTNFNGDGDVILEQISDYNSRGFKIGYTNFDKHGIIDSEGNYEINSRGNILSKYFNDRLERTFKYDGLGRLIEQTYCSSGDKVEYEYEFDEKYVVTEKYYQNGISSHFLKYKNDQNGNILNIETFRLPSLELIHKQISVYNEFGDELESYFVLQSGDKINWNKYEYEYDDKGNWVTKITKSAANENLQIVKREIEYYSLNKNSNTLIQTPKIEYLVSNFCNANLFVEFMKDKNYSFKIYDSENKHKEFNTLEEHESIWIGNLIQLNDVKNILKYSKSFYPHLKYVKVFFEDIDNNTIFIGGSTSSALELFNCIDLDEEDFDRIQLCASLNELYLHLNNFSEED